MEADYGPIAFTRTVDALRGDCNDHGECFSFGSFAGCSARCPALIKGECEIPEENVSLIKEAGAEALYGNAL